MNSPKFSAADAHRLVDLLATDDGFRAAFALAPIDAVREKGLISEGIQEELFRRFSVCFEVRKLASKQEILVAREQIGRMLTSGASQAVPMLEAAPAEQRSLRVA